MVHRHKHVNNILFIMTESLTVLNAIKRRRLGLYIHVKYKLYTVAGVIVIRLKTYF